MKYSHELLGQLYLHVRRTHPLPCIKPCKTLYKVTADRSLLFMISYETFHITSNIPIPLFFSLTLGIITIVVHASAARMCPSQNDKLITLTSLSQRLVSISFTCVASLSQTLQLFCPHPQ